MRSTTIPDRFLQRGPLLAVGVGLALMLMTGSALAGVLSPIAQVRVVRSETTDTTTGFTCLQGGGGPPLPGCPIDLGTFVTLDSETAPGFALFDEIVTTSGGSASQTSSIEVDAVTAVGAASASSSAAELTDPCCIFVLQTVDPDTDSDFEVTVDLDEATPYTFTASGWIEHPDPNIPVIGAALLDVAFDGPGGSLGTLQAVFDPLCSNSPSMFVCRVEPTPLVLSGTLPAGSYTITVHLEANAAGNWLPSTGPLGASASGAYDVSLQLGPDGTPVPVLGPVAVGVLAALLTGLTAVRAARSSA